MGVAPSQSGSHRHSLTKVIARHGQIGINFALSMYRSEAMNLLAPPHTSDARTRGRAPWPLPIGRGLGAGAARGVTILQGTGRV